MNRLAAEIVGESIDSGILLQTSRPRWYENLSTGTELDFLILLLLLPVVVVSWLIPKKHVKTEGIDAYEGLVYCVTTPTRVVFLSAESKWIATKLVAELSSFPLSDICDVKFSHSHSTPVLFVFTKNTNLELYFSGVWSDLASFKSKAVTGYM